ncbi:MAG: YcxB family protein [Bacteroidetes bacterium]|nr:YcxB family protein [Fibrella sp.]
MIIKTKKYALDQKTYISLAMRQWLRDNWQWGFVPLGLILLNVVLNLTRAYPNYWLYIVIVLLTVLYVLFWGIQFTGVTQSEQFKPMFQKYVYEIDSRQILMRVNAKEGGILKWNQIKNVVKNKEAYVLLMSNEDAVTGMALNPLMKYMARQMARAQFLYLPYAIFTSDTDLKFMDTILRRKSLLAE